MKKKDLKKKIGIKGIISEKNPVLVQNANA